MRQDRGDLWVLMFVGFGEYFGSPVRFVLKPGHAEEWKPGKEQTRKPWGSGAVVWWKSRQGCNDGPDEAVMDAGAPPGLAGAARSLVFI